MCYGKEVKMETKTNLNILCYQKRMCKQGFQLFLNLQQKEKRLQILFVLKVRDGVHSIKTMKSEVIISTINLENISIVIG